MGLRSITDLKNEYECKIEALLKINVTLKDMEEWATDPSSIPDNREGTVFCGLITDYEEFLEYFVYYKNFKINSEEAYKRDCQKTLTTEKRHMKYIGSSLSDSWGHYKAKLTKKGFTNIPEIESSSKNIIELLKDETPRTSPCRGAIIGNVQSGKTANMEALISMASDNGWNIFIILSGTIKNLCSQTQERMIRELRKDSDDPNDSTYTIEWLSLDPLTTPKKFYDQMGGFDLSETSRKRYMAVCLKHTKHLTNVINLLGNANNASQMKILVIDDEADQASVNASKKKRSSINSLIINLIYGCDKRGNENRYPFKSVNYICYTATPYAILLNECGNRTLYPADYISALTPSDLYLGPDRIFSKEPNALSNKMVIIDDHISDPVSHLMDAPELIPDSMKDAICWFICCVAIQRSRNYGKPVSMMLNIDFKKKEHTAVDRAICWYLNESKNDIIDRCRDQYGIQTKFTASEFKTMVPSYGMSSGHYPEILDYPPFEDIESLIREIINMNPTRIELDREGSDDVKIYDSQIYVCVDNCGKETEAINGEAFFTGRLSYPSKGDISRESTPAFIVIGGNTLSRGLTIEGLVVTYFRRIVKQADTLLQMGRWFGFRKGYELLPRIWMDSNAETAFEDLNEINEALLSKIEEYQEEGITPATCSVRIKNVPEAHMLKSLTAKYKMRGAVHDVTFDGGNDKYISKYCSRAEDLRYNLDSTRELLSNIAESHITENERGSILFTKVDKRTVLDYLEKFKRPHSSNVTSGDACIKGLCQIPDEIDAFNIVLSGNVKPVESFGNDAVWHFGSHKVNKMTRSAESTIDEQSIFIKTPRDKKDLLTDIDAKVKESLTETEMKLLKSGDIGIRSKCRNESGWTKTPLLLLGIVNDYNGGSAKYPEDVVTLSLLIPTGVKGKTQLDGEYVYLDDRMGGPE